MGGVVDTLTGKQKKDRESRRLMEIQKQEEEARLAEEESDIERRKAVARTKSIGRRQLMTGSATGLKKTMGGTGGE